MRGKIPLFLRLTLVAVIAFVAAMFLPAIAMATTATHVAAPVLDEGTILSAPSTDYGMVVAPSVATSLAEPAGTFGVFWVVAFIIAFTVLTITAFTKRCRSYYGVPRGYTGTTRFAAKRFLQRGARGLHLTVTNFGRYFRRHSPPPTLTSPGSIT